MNSALVASEFTIEGERNFMNKTEAKLNTEQNLERHVKDIYFDTTDHLVSYQADQFYKDTIKTGYILFNKEKFMTQRFPLISENNSEYMAVVIYDAPNWYYAAAAEPAGNYMFFFFFAS